jgi:hypothetical protein
MAQDSQSLIAEYRAGLEAELALLRQLESLSERQQAATVAGQFADLHDIHDARERVMRSLVTLEHDLKPVRSTLADRRHLLRGLAEFQGVATLHGEAADMVARIIASDQESLTALQEAERARRAAASATERGETTLQAYRRVVAPTTAQATLVDRRG